MNTIVLATDGSPSAAQATKTAIELAQATGARIHVVTAWSIPVSAFGAAPLLAGPELEDIECARAREAGTAAVEEIAAAGLPVSLEVREGPPVEEICAAADEQAADLVVLGAHGWGALKRLLVGSVSTGVVHRSPCPVLVARGGAVRAEDEPGVAASTQA
ncbi:MAG TPA: universal stress protein [Gaiellaceae bacterium]|jgi:nucleotide-binding universal stress UspA family protein